MAEILEVDEQTVADAIDQARDEQFQARLDQAVEDERITQEKADAIAERYADSDSDERPDGTLRQGQDVGRQARLGRR